MATDSLRPRIHYATLNPSRDEVRFLEIDRASRVDDPLVCRLVTRPLRPDLDFIAVSSLLGDPTTRETIQLDRAPIPVPVNIAQALRYVRAVFYPVLQRSSQDSLGNGSGVSSGSGGSSGGSSGKKSSAPAWLKSLLRHVGGRDHAEGPKLRVWIDCICVNAAHARESAKHRVTMYHVYQRAHMVVGWLGLKGPDTDAGVALIQAFDQAMPKPWQEPGDRAAHPEDYAPQHVWAVPVMHLFDPRTAAAAGTAEMLNRDFFHRRWILEEMAMARVPTFLVGDAIVSWQQILRLNLAMEEFKDYASDVCPAATRPLIHEFPLGTIHELLGEFERRKAMARVESLNSHSVSGSTTSGESKGPKERSLILRSASLVLFPLARRAM